MGSNVTTRATRTAAGKCAVCLRRAVTPGHPTCGKCRDAIAAYSADRYAARTKNRVCVRCGDPADGYLCETHAEERRVRRRGR